MSVMITGQRIVAALEANAYASRAWRKGLTVSKARPFQSSKPMSSTRIAHGTSPQPTSDFLHRGSTIDGPGNTLSSRVNPIVEVPISSAPPPDLLAVSAAALEAQDKSRDQANIPAYHRGSKYDRVPYWQKIPRWQNVGEKDFLSYRWNIKNDVQGEEKLWHFLREVLPERLPDTFEYKFIRTRDDFIQDVFRGIMGAPMSIRLTPHILASIDWNDPLGDPMARQFIPRRSTWQPDHPKLELDPLHEKEDMPVEGLVHRYTDKCLFLALSHCPLYCRFCTRAYSVGAETETVTKCSQKPSLARWDAMLQYIADTPAIQDVVISGGDSYSLQPNHLDYIGGKLLDIPNVRRFRVATKGLCAHPSRTLDPADVWTDVLINLSNEGKLRGKQVALHTHFNHPNEISWITREAAQKLFVNGVTVRNQTVLLRGVNDDAKTIGTLLQEIAGINIHPYYVYACDLTKGIEEFRTPVSTLINLEKQLRGSIAGFEFPNFIVDLPGGGGKRSASSYETYDRTTGRSTWLAPAVRGKGKMGKVYQYFDPLFSLPDGGKGVDFSAM